MRRTLRPAIALALLFALSTSVATPALAAPKTGGTKVLTARQAEDTSEINDEMMRLADEKRDESISRLKELLSSTDVEGDPKAEMMLRLAELYYAKGRARYLREMRDFDKAFDACFNTEGCSADNIKPDNADSKAWFEKAIKLYDNILKAYPRYPRADQALFFSGAARQDIGQKEEAVEQFKKLVKTYPESSFVPDAYVLIGEFYFEGNNAFKALQAYQAATKFPNSDKYPFALYKLAWCYYNVGEYSQAIESMKAVIAHSMQQQEAGSKSAIQLQDEALNDIVRFFADAEQLDEAYDYLGKLGKKDLIRKMLKLLAATYFTQGKFEKSIDTYRRLVLDDPSSKDCPNYQHEIVTAYRKLGAYDRTLEEVDRLRKDYGKTSAWGRANSSATDAVTASVKLIEEDIRKTAVEYHNQARTLDKSKHPDAGKMYDLASKAYTWYLEEFPQGENVYEVRYAFAELLYKRKRFAEAFDQYLAVVAIDPKGKHSKFCAESAIYAADEMVKTEGGYEKKGPPPKGKMQGQDLTDWEKRLVESCGRYADLYPGDEKVVPIIYKSAYLLYHKYRFAESGEQFKKVIALNPGSKQAEQGANLILDALSINEDWDSLKSNSKFYYDQKGLGGGDFKKEMYGIYQRSSLKVIEVAFEKDKDAGKAADAYVMFYGEFPDADTAPQALNNASVYYHQVKRVADAMKVRHILVDDPRFGPKTKYYYDQVASLGYDYETIADFKKSADLYEKLFSLYPEQRKKMEKEPPEKITELEQKAAAGLYSAALFRNALGDTKTAVANYNLYITTFKTDPKLNDIRFAIGKIYENTKDWTSAANLYLAFYTKDAKDAGPEYLYYARLHYAQALEAQGQGKKAAQVYEETVKMYRDYIKGGGKPAAHTEYAAQMMIKLLEPKFEAYKAIRLKGAGGTSKSAEDKALKASLTAKTQALTQLIQGYTEVVQAGAGEWGLAALVKLGEAYEEMGAFLKNGDIPFYLTEDQRELYVMAIDDKVYVQQSKSVEAYQLALEKSFELTLYNENTGIATRRLGALRPDDFSGLEEMIPTVRQSTTKKASFSYEKEL